MSSTEGPSTSNADSGFENRTDQNDPSSEVGNLETEAKRRKERLLALRQKLSGAEGKDSTSERKAGLPKSVFTFTHIRICRRDC